MKLFVNVLVLLFAALAANAEEELPLPPCYQPCTKEMKPVCGRNNNNQYTSFSNECELGNAKCFEEYQGWVKYADGACVQADEYPPCMRWCTRERQPVCAINNNGEFKTFNNECELLNEQCVAPGVGWVEHMKGECLSPCYKQCTKELRPICARNNLYQFRTFNNDCELENEQCTNYEAEWTKYMDGQCPDVPMPCIRACTLDYRPICARNNEKVLKTLSNSCELLNLQCIDPKSEWVNHRNGECPFRPRCIRFCTDEYNPVCGINLKQETRTFPNSCQFANHRCVNQEDGWVLNMHSECPVLQNS